MGIDLATFRARIGCFAGVLLRMHARELTKPCKTAAHDGVGNGWMGKGHYLLAANVILLLLQRAGVEQNPGPGMRAYHKRKPVQALPRRRFKLISSLPTRSNKSELKQIMSAINNLQMTISRQGGLIPVNQTETSSSRGSSPACCVPLEASDKQATGDDDYGRVSQSTSDSDYDIAGFSSLKFGIQLRCTDVPSDGNGGDSKEGDSSTDRRPAEDQGTVPAHVQGASGGQGGPSSLACSGSSGGGHGDDEDEDDEKKRRSEYCREDPEDVRDYEFEEEETDNDAQSSAQEYAEPMGEPSGNIPDVCQYKGAEHDDQERRTSHSDDTFTLTSCPAGGTTGHGDRHRGTATAGPNVISQVPAANSNGSNQTRFSLAAYSLRQLLRTLAEDAAVYMTLFPIHTLSLLRMRNMALCLLATMPAVFSVQSVRAYCGGRGRSLHRLFLLAVERLLSGRIYYGLRNVTAANNCRQERTKTTITHVSPSNRRGEVRDGGRSSLSTTSSSPLSHPHRPFSSPISPQVQQSESAAPEPRCIAVDLPPDGTGPPTAFSFGQGGGVPCLPPPSRRAGAVGTQECSYQAWESSSYLRPSAAMQDCSTAPPYRPPSIGMQENQELKIPVDCTENAEAAQDAGDGAHDGESGTTDTFGLPFGNPAQLTVRRRGFTAFCSDDLSEQGGIADDNIVNDGHNDDGEVDIDMQSAPHLPTEESTTMTHENEAEGAEGGCDLEDGANSVTDVASAAEESAAHWPVYASDVQHGFPNQRPPEGAEGGCDEASSVRDVASAAEESAAHWPVCGSDVQHGFPNLRPPIPAAELCDQCQQMEVQELVKPCGHQLCHGCSCLACRLARQTTSGTESAGSRHLVYAICPVCQQEVKTMEGLDLYAPQEY